MQTFCHQLLIASPKMAGNLFYKRVVYVLEHTPQNTIGIIINNEALKVNEDLLDNLGLPKKIEEVSNLTAFEGGPIDKETGFVLHDSKQQWDRTWQTDDGLSLSMSRNLIHSVIDNEYSENHRLVMGYCGWLAHQLEEEILDGCWHIAPYDENIVFHLPTEKRWSAALALIKVNSSYLSRECGYA